MIKCFLDQIEADQVGLTGLPLAARPICPSCSKAIGMIQMVRGRPALKLNQGAIQPIRL